MVSDILVHDWLLPEPGCEPRPSLMQQHAQAIYYLISPPLGSRQQWRQKRSVDRIHHNSISGQSV